MNGEILLTLAVTGGALALFIWNRVRADVVGIVVMVTLIVLGLVTPQQGISGFANEAVVTVAAMFVLSAGLVRTGAVDLLGRWVSRLAGDSELRLLVVALVVAVPASAFINNTPVVVVMVPLVVGIARQKGFTTSRLLMPISFGSQMGGTLTLIGTSTNLLVAGLVLDLGLERIRLFDITPPALILAVIGLVYLLTVGRWLTPVREERGDLTETYALRDYLSALVVEPDSGMVDRTLAESRFGETFGLQVVAIERQGGAGSSLPGASTVVRAGDALIVRGATEQIARAAESEHLRVKGTRTPAIEASEHKLAEVIVPPRSQLIGRTLRGLQFRARFGFPVLGVQRHGELLQEVPGEVRLEAGDVLLVQGAPSELRALREGRELALLGPVDLPIRRTRRLKLAGAILIGVVLLAAFDITTILVSSLLGVVAMFATGCIRPDEAYLDVDWMVLVLLGSIIPLGIAMQNTGTAEFVAGGLVALTAPLGLVATLAAFYLLTSLLTEVISNNAAAVVMTPIAVATAAALGVSPLPFVVAVMISASNSFMTPIGYQTNTFVFGPGGYRFSDFLRVGGPLNLLMLVAAALVIPLFFPF
jgi:di/tricarboxylate transporter